MYVYIDSESHSASDTRQTWQKQRDSDKVKCEVKNIVCIPNIRLIFAVLFLYVSLLVRALSPMSMSINKGDVNDTSTEKKRDTAYLRHFLTVFALASFFLRCVLFARVHLNDKLTLSIHTAVRISDDQHENCRPSSSLSLCTRTLSSFR